MPLREFFNESRDGLASPVKSVPVRREGSGDQNLAQGAQNGLDDSINGFRSTTDRFRPKAKGKRFCRFERKFRRQSKADFV